MLSGILHPRTGRDQRDLSELPCVGEGRAGFSMFLSVNHQMPSLLGSKFDLGGMNLSSRRNL